MFQLSGFFHKLSACPMAAVKKNNRHIIGLEILDASKKLSLENITTVTIANLPAG